MGKEIRFNLHNVGIKESIAKAVELYNRYRSPEAVSKIIEIKGNSIKIAFEGHFCATCAVNDWIEDFKYVLEDIGIQAELENIIEPYNTEENWRIAIFKLKNISYD
ncbi:MAG: hypothetical protein N3D82_05345 [Ignisphaera sp.]|nr:hypothetical protein [Ignisphaera sp.]MCX8168432.1 hypothetical protein [Ignisphaera sp.]MDW8086055.1 hypothetical protein [Ignisphaera sp.]